MQYIVDMVAHSLEEVGSEVDLMSVLPPAALTLAIKYRQNS